MATRAEIRTQARVALEDSGSAPLWSDSDLNTFAALALQEYGRWEPVSDLASVVVSSGATTVAHPASVPPGGIVAIYDGRGSAVALNERAGLGPSLSAYTAQGWRSWGSTVYLVRPVSTDEAGTWTINYLGARSLPANDSDPMPIEPGHEPVVVQLIVAGALHRRAVEDYKRGVVKPSIEAVGAARDLAREMFGASSRRARGGVLDVA